MAAGLKCCAKPLFGLAKRRVHRTLATSLATVQAENDKK
jgi:hypothetical protein